MNAARAHQPHFAFSSVYISLAVLPSIRSIDVQHVHHCLRSQSSHYLVYCLADRNTFTNHRLPAKQLVARIVSLGSRSIEQMAQALANAAPLKPEIKLSQALEEYEAIVSAEGKLCRRLRILSRSLEVPH